MSAVVDRAFTAALEHGYGAHMIHALLRMARDADAESGENCATSLKRIQQAAGYGQKDRQCKSARRARDRFIADGIVRVDVEAPGIGWLYTVCPVAPWSGVVPNRNEWFRRLLAYTRNRTSQDSAVLSTQDTNVLPGQDTSQDTGQDSELSYDQGTKGPTPPSLMVPAGHEAEEKPDPAGAGKATTAPRPPDRNASTNALERYESNLAAFVAAFPDHDEQQIAASLVALRSRRRSKRDQPTYLEVLRDLGHRFPAESMRSVA